MRDAPSTSPRTPLQGRVAVVIGGAGGIGRQCAANLVTLGASVAVVDLNQAAVDEVCSALPGSRVRGYAIDAANEDLVVDGFAQIAADFGGVDILITAQGFPRDGRLLDMSRDQFLEVIDSCLVATFLTVREAARLMIPRGYGRIINISSRAWQGNPGQSNYSSAKAGVVGLTKAVAKELGRHGITANAIAPGLIETPSLRALETFDAISERAVKASSVKRLGSVDDVAAAVEFLASEASGFITGEVLHVSGGRFS